VYIQVASSEYAVKANEGNQQFEAKTDADGKFTILVKTGAKEIGKGTKAKFKTDDFKYKVGDRTIYYEALDEEIDPLNAGDFREEYFVAKEDAVLNQTVGVAIVKGKVTYDAGFSKKTDGTWEEKTHVYASNVNVIASVTYFAKTADEVVKKFTTKSNANGDYSFEIPVEADGDSVALNIEQFQADSISIENGDEVKRPRFYTMSKPVELKKEEVQANVTLIRELKADKTEAIPNDKKITKFNVIANVYQQVEEKIVEEGTVKGYKTGHESTKYTVTVRLDYYDDTHTKILSTILYPGNATNKDDQINVTAELYDQWKLSNVKISIYADKSDKPKDGYAHYMYKADTKTYDLPTDPKDMKADAVSGIFKGGKDAVIVSGFASEKQLFFDYTFEKDVVIPFEVEDPAKVRGRMSMMPAASDPERGYSDTNAGAYTVAIHVGGDDASNIKYYKKEAVFDADLLEKGDKKILMAANGTAGLVD
jgi:hypothetical protein